MKWILFILGFIVLFALVVGYVLTMKQTLQEEQNEFENPYKTTHSMKLTWQEYLSIKQLIKLEQMPNGEPQNLFDVFGNVQHEKIVQEPANKSEQWLKQQDQLTDEIIEKHFIEKALNQREIELLVEAIEEYCQPEDEQFTEDLYSKFKDTAKQIATEYIKPLQLNEKTLYALIDQVTEKLEKRNAKHIEESNKEAMRQSIRLKGITGEYTKAQVEDVLQSLENMWATPQENNEPYFEDVQVGQKDSYPVYDFPLMMTKQTIRFWQLEAENLDIQIAEKLQQIAQTITDNIGRKPFTEQLTLPVYAEWI